MKLQGMFLLSPGRDASSSHGYPQQHIAGTHLYTWVKRDKVEKVSCLRNNAKEGLNLDIQVHIYLFI